MSEEAHVSEWRQVLAALLSLEREGSPATAGLIARRARRDEEVVERLLKAAENSGYVTRGIHDWALTETGLREAAQG